MDKPKAKLATHVKKVRVLQICYTKYQRLMYEACHLVLPEILLKQTGNSTPQRL